MDELKKPLEDLKQAISRLRTKGKKSQYAEAVGYMESHLILLRSSSISQALTQKLCNCLREPLLPVYAGLPGQTLRLAAQLSRVIYENKILAEYTAGKHDQKSHWEAVLNSLLSGVLDYLDNYENADTKEAIGSTMYSPLCSISFSLSMPFMTSRLRCTAYTLLSESAYTHKANQKKLRDPDFVGGAKLGAQLWRTKDFLVMEALLNLFARLLPSSNNSSAGRANRTAFTRSVFMSVPETAKTGEQVVKMLGHVPSSDWDPTAAKIMEILAASNITFPQPFVVNEVVACGKVQPSDRLYADDRGLCANVVIQEDQYESLEVPYSTICKVSISYSNGVRNPHIIVELTSPPLVGKAPLVPDKDTDGGAEVNIVFSVYRDDVPRFHDVLKSRGLRKLVHIFKPSKLSIADSVANLELDAAGKFVDKAERYENLSQLYGTNDPSDGPTSVHDSGNDDTGAATILPSELPLMSSPVAQGKGSSSSSPQKSCGQEIRGKQKPAHSKSPFKESPHADALAQANVRKAKSFAAESGPPHTLRRSTTKDMRDAVFGGSDEELSDIEFTQEAPFVLPSVFRAASHHSRCSSTNHKPAVAPPAGRRIVISDDEKTAAAKPPRASRLASSKMKIKKAVDISDDEIEEILPPTALLEVSRRRSTLLKTPTRRSITVSKPALETSSVSVRANPDTGDAGIVPAVISRLPDPNVPLSEPDTLYASEHALLDLGLNTIANSVSPDRSIPLADTVSAVAAPALVPDMSTPAPEKSCAIPTGRDQRHVPHENQYDNLVQSSSPMPLVKAECKSIKDSPRKKNQPPSEVRNKSSHVSGTKRKRGVLIGDTDQVAPSSDDLRIETNSRQPMKRLKREPSSDTIIPSEKTESQVLRPRTTAATRAKKRYRGKKGRASSPIPSSMAGVDYDEIPSNTLQPPEQVLEKLSSPVPEKRAIKNALVDPEVESGKNVVSRTRAATLSGKKKNRLSVNVKLPSAETNAARKKQSTPVFKEEHANDESLAGDDMKSCQQREQDKTSPRSATTKNAGIVKQHTPIIIREAKVDSPRQHRSKDHERPQMRPKSSRVAKKKSNKAPWEEFGLPEDCVVEHQDDLLLQADVPSDQTGWPTGTSTAMTDNPSATMESAPFEKRTANYRRRTIQPISSDHNSLDTKNNMKDPTPSTKPEPASKDVSKSTAIVQTVTMIDLTKEDSPITKPSVRAGNTAVVSPIRSPSAICNRFLPDVGSHIREPLSPPLKGSRPIQSVTFASHVEERALSSIPMETQRLPAINARPTKHWTDHQSPVEFDSSQYQESRVTPRKRSQIQAEYRVGETGIQEIVEVLNDIQEAVLYKITSKCDTVKHDIRTRRDRLLSEAAADLLRMRAESVEHFNTLITLEAEYASFERKLSHALEDLVKMNQAACGSVREMIVAHDRDTIVKNMPRSLFSSPLPRCIAGCQK